MRSAWRSAARHSTRIAFVVKNGEVWD